jgi:hypothetical protein
MFLYFNIVSQGYTEYGTELLNVKLLIFKTQWNTVQKLCETLCSIILYFFIF